MKTTTRQVMYRTGADPDQADQPRMTPQQRAVAAKLQADGSVSMHWAIREGIQLRTRVFELRQMGWVIETAPDGWGEGYVLMQAPGEPPRRPGLWS